MSRTLVFAHTERELLPLLEELRQLEPIFHTTEFGTTPAQHDFRMDSTYWEVGASGRRYSRAFLLKLLANTEPVLADTAAWVLSDEALRRLAENTYLFTYTLRQGDRLTRRSTIWRNDLDGWRILFHQGTIVSAEEDDLPPS